jgi:hypothetical protein
MSRQSISLKTRVRYEGRAKTYDRRATKGADLEKLPNPMWRMVGTMLRSKFKKTVEAHRQNGSVVPSLTKARPAAAPVLTSAASGK